MSLFVNNKSTRLKVSDKDIFDIEDKFHSIELESNHTSTTFKLIMKVKKNLTLHQDQVTKGVKIATLKNRSFSDMVGGLIEQEFDLIEIMNPIKNKAELNSISKKIKDYLKEKN